MKNYKVVFSMDYSIKAENSQEALNKASAILAHELNVRTEAVNFVFVPLIEEEI